MKNIPWRVPLTRRISRNLKQCGFESASVISAMILFAATILQAIISTRDGVAPVSVMISCCLGVIQALFLSIMLVIMAYNMRQVANRRNRIHWELCMAVETAATTLRQQRGEVQEHIHKLQLQAFRAIQDERRKDGEGWKGP